MLNNLYSCYSSICWPFICCRTSTSERQSPDEDIVKDDDLFDISSIINNEKSSSNKRKSFGSIADDTLPTLVPQIYVDNDDDEHIENNDKYIITGNLQVTCQYSYQKKLLIIIVDETNDVDTNSTGIQLQVRLCQCDASPSKKHRTKSMPGPSAKFGQTFTFTMEPEELLLSKIRFRLYRYKSSIRPSQFYGECHLKTAKIDIRQGTLSSTHLLRFKIPNKQNVADINETPKRPVDIQLSTDPETMINRQGSIAISGQINSSSPSRRNSTVDSAGRFCALPTPNGQPEALISLCYLEQPQKIVVTVDKASNLDDSSDTFLKISVISQYGEELAKHRSPTIKATSDPQYECTAVFQIPKHELETSSVLIQVFRNSGMLRRRTQIGFVCVGENASSPDAQTHWEQMIQGLGTSVEKWHYLQRPAITK